MTKEEHLQWCKDRAMEYWQRGELGNAVASMMSDMNPRPGSDTLRAFGLALGMMHVAQGDSDGVRRWIEGWR